MKDFLHTQLVKPAHEYECIDETSRYLSV